MNLEKNSYFQLLFVIVFLIILYISRMVVIVSLIGIGIGVLISPLLDHLQKWFKLRRGVCALFLIIGLLILMALIGGFIGWIIFEQGSSLIEAMPGFSAKLRTQLENMFDRFPSILEQIKGFDFVGTLQGIGKYLIGGIQSGFVVIGGVILVLIIGIYLAVDGDLYFNGTVRAFPPQHRDRVHDLLKKCAYVTRVWFRAQLLDMAIIGLITTVGLWIAGVEYWALFGLLTALFGIIPYVGVMVVVVIVSLITVASEPSQVPWVFLVFFITQQIEGNVVLPWVMKGQSKIPEALLIIVMPFFGFWFGLPGVFIAPPLVGCNDLSLPKSLSTGHRDALVAGHQFAPMRSEIRWTPTLITVMIHFSRDLLSHFDSSLKFELPGCLSASSPSLGVQLS